MAVNSLDVVFAFDGKIWRSLWVLIAFPGRLTREWLDGKIARYVHPSKLFWFLSIVFFALLVGATRGGEFKKEVEKAKAEQVEKEQERKGDFEIMLENDGAGAVTVTQKFLAWAPYLMLVLAPVFALLVRMFYRRRGMYYADYLVFALHFHAFLFLFYSLSVAVKLIRPELLGAEVYKHLFFSAGILVPWIYLIISLRRVFGAKFAYSVLKTISITVLYLLAMVMIVVAVTIGWMAVTGKQG